MQNDANRCLLCSASSVQLGYVLGFEIERHQAPKTAGLDTENIYCTPYVGDRRRTKVTLLVGTSQETYKHKRVT